MSAHYPTGGAPVLPLDLLAQSIPMLTRNDLEALTERLIDVLDGMDGDCDLEDGTDAEDDFSLSPYAAECASGELGCPIADPDFCAVERGDLATHESFTQGCGSALHEDDDDEPQRGPAIMEGEGFANREAR